MKTPIADFLKNYAASDPVRAHMPGHKGAYSHDITEITGADSLFDACGIIAQSEKNASQLFDAHTFYSTEGSSLSIRAMIYLVRAFKGRSVTLLAGRNAHKSFVSACALTDADIEWIYGDSYLTCSLSPKNLKVRFESGNIPDAVYLTSPDYLGNMQDIKGIAKVCRQYNVLLLVDNAHGAYLKFLGCHPMDLGADISCDSAHKTLPVLTGGGYLHISKSAPEFFVQNAKTALSLFGSTSPSYLILESLDKTNVYLENHRERLTAFLATVQRLRDDIPFELCGDEPLKLTLKTKSYGYTGYDVASFLESQNIYCEFADPDYLVLMLTPENAGDIEKIAKALKALPKMRAITDAPPVISVPVRAMTVRDAVLSRSELVDADKALGRIAAAVTVGCPPAVPIVVSGERISPETISAFKYYGIDKVRVIEEDLNENAFI